MMVVAVVVDVGGELGLVAPPDDALLAARRGLPVHFQLQLVGLDEPRGIGEPLAERPEEEKEAVSLGLVVVEGGIGHRAAAAQDRAPGQADGRIRVPCLRGDGRGPDKHAEGEDGGESRTAVRGERDAHAPPLSRPVAPRATVHARCTPPRPE